MSVVPITPTDYLIGEGPHWEEKTQSLLFIDIFKKLVCRWKDGQVEHKEFDERVSVILPCEDGGYIATQDRKLIHFKWDDHTNFEVLTEVTDGSDKLNDGKCDAMGRLFIGTMPLFPHPPPIPDTCGLYTYKDGSLEVKVPNIQLSNGLAWTADNNTMYHIDSIPRKIYAFDFDLSTGDMSNRRVAVDWSTSSLEEYGYPDGMCIDENENLWIASFGTGKVFNFDPRSGKEITSISIPGATFITSVCFGGANYDELYVTTAISGDLTAEGKLKEDYNAGACFKVTGLGVKGRAPFNSAIKRS